MKKYICMGVLLVSCFWGSAYAFDYQIFDLRNKLFEESKEIKSLIAESPNAALMTSLFDSCLITMTQVDAYFSMLGVFESVKQNDLTDAPLKFMTGWLMEIRKTNEININLLKNMPEERLTGKEKFRVGKLKEYFGLLNDRVDAELNKFAVLKKSVKSKKR